MNVVELYKTRSISSMQLLVTYFVEPLLWTKVQVYVQTGRKKRDTP